MSDSQKGDALRTVRRLFALLLILGLGAAVVWLLSERNARSYAVELRDGELWILRGRTLPTGFEPYRPSDALLAQAYANLPVLPGDSTGELLLAPFADREALDQALFRTLKGWVEARLEDDTSERLAQGLRLLRRLELLPGSSAEQREQLKDLQTRAAYVEGRARVDEAQAALREAVARLRIASERRGRYAREAGELLERVGALSEQLSRSVRAPLGAPTAAEARPEPLPAEKPEAAEPEVPAAAPDAGAAAAEAVPPAR